MTDRCDGTLTRVTQGAVTVRDFARARTSSSGPERSTSHAQVSWVSVFAGFLVAHMVGDYLLQTDWQARHKRGGLGGDPVARRALLTHVTTYTLAFVPALIWIADELDPTWAIVSAVLIFLPHLMIDDGRLVARLPEPRQARGRVRGGRRRLGRPVLPRAVAVGSLAMLVGSA